MFDFQGHLSPNSRIVHPSNQKSKQKQQESSWMNTKFLTKLRHKRVCKRCEMGELNWEEYRRWLGTGAGCPRRLCSLHPCSYSNPSWTWLWENGCHCPCSEQQCKYDDLQRPLQSWQVCGTGQQKVLSIEMCVNCHPTAVLRVPESEQPGRSLHPLQTHSPLSRVSVYALLFSQVQTDVGGNALPFAQLSCGQSSQLCVWSSFRSVYAFYSKQSWGKTKHNNIWSWTEKPWVLHHKPLFHHPLASWSCAQWYIATLSLSGEQRVQEEKEIPASPSPSLSQAILLLGS